MNRTRLFSVLASAVMIFGGCKGNGTLLPNVSGKAGEIIVAMDKNDWDGNLGSTTRTILAADYPFLPQQEPLFSLSNVPVTGFADLFKVHRNLLFFNISKSDQSGVVYKNDVWAHPQCVIQVTAPTSDSAAVILKENSERIINSFEQAERDRIIANSIRYEEHSIPPAVKEMTGGSPHFPSGFKLRKKTSDFLWISDDKQYVTQGVFIYRYPAAENDNFSMENIIAHRDAALRENVPVWMNRTMNRTADDLRQRVFGERIQEGRPADDGKE